MDRGTQLLIFAGVMLLFVVVLRVSGFGSNSRIDDQAELLRRSADWRGANGLEGRAREVRHVRGDRLRNAILAALLLAVAVWLLARHVL